MQKEAIYRERVVASARLTSASRDNYSPFCLVQSKFSREQFERCVWRHKATPINNSLGALKQHPASHTCATLADFSRWQRDYISRKRRVILGQPLTRFRLSLCVLFAASICQARFTFHRRHGKGKKQREARKAHVPLTEKMLPGTVKVKPRPSTKTKLRSSYWNALSHDILSAILFDTQRRSINDSKTRVHRD